jgi:simple sugar transport system permease protein
LGVFGLLGPSGESSTFAVSTPKDFIQFTPFAVPAMLTGRQPAQRRIRGW